MAGFRPLHDRVVCWMKRVEAEEKTPGGIIIPDTAKEKPVEARCLLSARASVTRPARFARSMSRWATHVLFGKWAGTEVIIDWRRPADPEGSRHSGRSRTKRPRAREGGLTEG